MRRPLLYSTDYIARLIITVRQKVRHYDIQRHREEEV